MRESPELEIVLDGGAGPALPIDDAAAAAIVGGALDAVYGPAPGGGGGGGGAGLKIAAVAIAIAVIGGGAYLAMKPRPVAITVTEVTPGPSTLTPPPTVGAPVPAAPPEIDITTPATKPETVKPHPTTTTTTPTATPPSPDLLAMANAARARREWADADKLYGQVVDAGGAAAQTAAVASGDLRLDHLGDARGALARYQLALGGTLDEEARWGIAQVERALGDRAAEKRALDDFLAHHPHSMLVDTARTRLAQLGAK